MPGLSDLPIALRRYLVLIIAAGPLIVLTPVLLSEERFPTTHLWQTALLVLLTIAAERSSIHLTHKTAVSPVTACHLALVLVCPFPIAAVLALLAGLIGQLLRGTRDPIETAFNASQGAIAVLMAALTFHAVEGLEPVGPRLVDVGSLSALLLAALVLHVGNSLLVAIAAALHLGRSPARVFVVHVHEGLAAHAALLALGVTVAFLTLDAPILLPTLAIPLWLVRLALRENVRLRDDTHAALAALVEVVELRDPYTAGHSRRVAQLAQALALELGLTQEEADRIAAAGQVHDVGKVAVDPAVLMKPGKLTEDEYAEMQRHPVLGADVIARFAAYQTGVPLVRHHHEEWAGTGYPDRLAGEAIPLGARILAVADTYDALTSDRPYRAGMTRERALAILSEGAGTQWDPLVVGALLAHLGQAASVLASTAAITIPAAA